MQNETETPSMQSDSLSAASPHGTEGGNGFDSVASQYRAMQEAQILHEETINQLREEVRGQRERLAELARSNPSQQRNGSLDIVMLRLTELERKIGEGAPDPLINEIVHRLAALENAGPTRGLRDPRVDEILSKLEALRQNVSESAGTDSRTDDLVLRIASLEGAFRRAAQSRDPEEVQARIDALAEELNAQQQKELGELRQDFAELAKSAATAAGAQETDAAFAEALDQLSDRVSAIESKLAEPREDQRLTEIGSQLEALDRKLAEQDSSELQSRVEALEEKAAKGDLSEALGGVAGRVRAVEEKLQNLPASLPAEYAQQIDSLSNRVEALASKMEDPSSSQRLLEISGRVRGLEVRLDATPSSTKAVQELREQLARLEQTVGTKPGSADLARLMTELNALRVESSQASPSEDLSPRLQEIENRIAEVESASRLEDADVRLGVIEAKLSALGDPTDIGRRLTMLEMDDAPTRMDPRLEDALQRLAALESKPFETLSDSGLQDLRQSVADLHVELEKVSSERLPALTELPERLTRLEAKLQERLETERAEASPEPSDRSELLDALQAQVQSLGARLEDLSVQIPAESAHDLRVSELIARIDWVEQNAAGAAAQPASDIDLQEIRRRIEAIEEGLSLGSASGGLSPGVQAELGARLQGLEQAIDSLQAGAEANGVEIVATSLQKETDRWNQWARSTIQEIADLREQIEGGVAPAAGIDAESVEALAVQISNTLNTSEVKSLRGQMYFVYLALGVIWALLMYLLFTS